MCRVLMCAVAGALFISAAEADEVLNFRIVGHANSVQTQDVGDVDGHALVLARLSGLASFPDGSVATVYWTVQGDYIKGAGPAVAYVNVTFGDGSVLWYKAPVSAKSDGTNAGSVSVMGGKGRFEGAKGDGTVSGAAVGARETGVNVYFNVVINIKK
jgi:hypothetical protein